LFYHEYKTDNTFVTLVEKSQWSKINIVKFFFQIGLSP